jgi:hypothetical protein
MKTPRRLQEAAAGSGGSEHWNVHTLFPFARQRESLAGPNVPCERRTDLAAPHRHPHSSGIGPEQALEAITSSPARQRQS